eukprot:RCo013553
MLVRTRTPVASVAMPSGYPATPPNRSHAYGPYAARCLPRVLFAVAALLPAVLTLLALQWRLVVFRGGSAGSAGSMVFGPPPVVVTVTARNFSRSANLDFSCADVGGPEVVQVAGEVSMGVAGFRLEVSPRILRGAVVATVQWWATSWHPRDRIVLLSLPSQLYLSYRAVAGPAPGGNVSFELLNMRVDYLFRYLRWYPQNSSWVRLASSNLVCADRYAPMQLRLALPGT